MDYFFHTADGRAWNWFDACVVGLNVVDALLDTMMENIMDNITILRILRVVRITRVLRIIRVMKFFKDLRVMIQALASTIKTAFWALLLLLMSMYIFAIALSQIAADYVVLQIRSGSPMADDSLLVHYFGSLFKSLFTLFMSVAGGIDWEISFRPLQEVGPLPVAIYLMFIIFASFCLMNIIIGLFCQNAVEAFDKDKENMINAQLDDKRHYVEALIKMFDSWDKSRDDQITIEDFEKHLTEPRMQALLKTLDIERRDAVALFDLLDTDNSGGLDIDEFIYGCITFRGGAKAVQIEKLAIEHRFVARRVANMSETIDEILRLSNMKDNVTAAASHLRPAETPDSLANGSVVMPPALEPPALEPSTLGEAAMNGNKSAFVDGAAKKAAQPSNGRNVGLVDDGAKKYSTSQQVTTGTQTTIAVLRSALKRNFTEKMVQTIENTMDHVAVEVQSLSALAGKWDMATELHSGVVIEARAPILSGDASPTQIPSGARGTIVCIDEEGDAVVYIPQLAAVGCRAQVYIFKQDFNKLARFSVAE
jgi:hypothetical protein